MSHRERPNWILALLRRALPPGAVRDAVIGDMQQEHTRRSRDHGAWSARWWVFREGLGVLAWALVDRARGRGWRERTRIHRSGKPGSGGLRGTLQNLRLGGRALRRRPGFTLTSIATLALGLGLSTAMFAVVDAVLLEPLPLRDSDRLVGLWHRAPGLRSDEINQSPGTYFVYRDHSRTLESVGLWDNSSSTITGLSEPERVRSLLVSHSLLGTLGLSTVLGRPFSEADDQPAATGTVILSHAYWQERLGGDPATLGRVLTVDGNPHEVIGVLDDAFGRIFPRFDVLLPARVDRATALNGDFTYQAIGRLKADVTAAEAETDLASVLPRVTTDYPGPLTPDMLQEAGFAPVVRPLHEDVVGDIGSSLWLLLGAVAIVLLVACANVGNLYLVRLEGRQREFALRSALGAGKGAIRSLLMAEGLLLALAGGAAGLAVAALGLRLLRIAPLENLPRAGAIELDWSVAGFAVLASVLSGVALGVIAAARHGRFDPTRALKDRGGDGARGREGHYARAGLVMAQTAMALVLLVASGLLVRSFQALSDVDPGFERPEELFTVRLSLPPGLVADPANVVDVHRDILRRLEEIPGVTSSGASSSVAMDGNDSHNSLFIEELPTAPGDLAYVHRVKHVAGDYFGTMAIPLQAGRSITEGDLRDGRRAAVINDAFARTYWADPQSAVGKRLGLDPEGPWWEVVGVVGDVRDDGMAQEPVPILYLPRAGPGEDVEPFVARTLTHVVRSSRGDVAADMREAVWSVNPGLPLTSLERHDERVRESLRSASVLMAMIGIAAVLALLLGVVGIYGVVSHVVTQRTREIGLRMALGADRGAVSGMVVRQGMKVALWGVALGMVAAVGLTRLLSSALYGVSPLDPLTFGLVSVGLAGVALLATWLPAHRAAGVDPSDALRSD